MANSTSDGGIFRREGKCVSVVDDASTARSMLARIERLEAGAGVSAQQARSRLARRVGTGIATLENILRGRRKSIPSGLMTAIRVEMIRALQQQLQALEHEVHLARQTGVPHSDDDLAAAEAHLAATKQILEERS